MTTKEFENYEPKGQLIGFPKEIIARMLECQEEQGNPRDVTVFEKRAVAKQCIKGFDWGVTREDWDFWLSILQQNSSVKKLQYIGFQYRRKEISMDTEINKNESTQKQLLNFSLMDSLLLITDSKY